MNCPVCINQLPKEAFEFAAACTDDATHAFQVDVVCPKCVCHFRMTMEVTSTKILGYPTPLDLPGRTATL
jgi:hypothetical protein